jgi:hypothetical protein
MESSIAIFINQQIEKTNNSTVQFNYINTYIDMQMRDDM